MASESSVIVKWVLYFFAIGNVCTSLVSVTDVILHGSPRGFTKILVIEGIILLLIALFGFWGIRSENATAILTYGIIMAFLGCLRIVVAMVTLVTAAVDPKSRSGNFPIAFYGVIQILIGSLAVVYSKSLQSKSSEYRHNEFHEDLR